MNITKLSVWPKLQALGFEPINYYAHGKKVAIGAALRRTVKNLSGEDFKTDVICIQPSSFSDKRNYHITGEVKTPFYGKFHRYTGIGRKEEVTLLVDRINEYFRANKILPTVEMMLK